MNKQTEALKMAIEDAMKFVNTLNKYEDEIQSKPFKTEADKYLSYASVVIKSIATSLQEALAQPAQEPVAWMKSAIDNARDVCKYLDHDMVEEAKGHTEFFWNDLDKIREFDDTHPAPSWQGLSDDEKLAIIRKWKDAHTMREQELIGLGDAIEQGLKEKNHG